MHQAPYFYTAIGASCTGLVYFFAEDMRVHLNSILCLESPNCNDVSDVDNIMPAAFTFSSFLVPSLCWVDLGAQVTFQIFLHEETSP